MKPIAVLLWSVVGMTATSSTVAWMTPSGSDAPVSTVSTAAAAQPTPGRAASWTKTPEDAPKAVVADVADVAAPAVHSSFVADGLLHVEGRLGHTSLPRGQTRESFVLVSVDAPADRILEERPPVDVSIVIDRSGSMKGSRLRNAVAAARGMVGRLDSNDRVSLVAYDGQAQLLMPATRVADMDPLRFEQTLLRLRHGGNTCLSCGLELAMDQLRGRSGVGRVLLLSDGKANRGLTTAVGLRGLGDQARRDEMAIASIGVDVDYDETTMFAVSEASNGRHYFVENPSALPAVFEQEREAMVGTVADRASVDVTLADGIELLEVVDRPHQRRGNTVSLSLGSFTSGDAKTALLRVLVRPGERERSQSVASVQLAYHDLGAERMQTHRADLGIMLDADDAPPPALDPTVEARLGRKEAFDALLSANEAFDRGEVAEAEEVLEQARREIQSRRRRSADSPESAPPAVAADFDRQLEALGSASTGLRDASFGVAPKAAATQRRGKALKKKNIVSADPFSN